VTTDISVLRDVEVRLRDGLRTKAEVWLPSEGEPHPAILVRTPYLKECAAPTATVDARQATSRGYAVVLQDVRGCGGSEGTFYPFATEEADGFDSVGWVADQPWCNGDVVMAGSSYVGATQWLAAASAPPSLRAIAPTLSSDDYGEGWSYRAGVPELGFLTTWSVAGLVPEKDRMLDDPTRSWDDVGSAQAVAPWLHDWLANGPGSPYWRERSVAHRRHEIKLPVLVVAGWYDVFLAASLRSFARSMNRSDRLIVGPWAHTETLSHLVGVGNVGIAGLGDGVFGWILDFYDAVLAGRDPGSSRVRAYLLGARRWVDLECWPPAGGGQLEVAIDPGSFAVRPATPVPALGGRALLVQVPGWGYGIADQRPLVGRDDVHRAATIAVGQDTIFAGPVTADLVTSAEGVDGSSAYWVATLCLEQPGGALHNIAEGVVRTVLGAERAQVDLGDVFLEAPAGSTLVLFVAGSSFPRWPKPVSELRQCVMAGSKLKMRTP